MPARERDRLRDSVLAMWRRNNDILLFLLAQIPPGTLLVADRLYASVVFIAALSQHQLWGVCRLNRQVKVQQVKVLRRVHRGGGTLTERLVVVGSGQTAPPQRMRHIRWRARREALDLLTPSWSPRGCGRRRR